MKRLSIIVPVYNMAGDNKLSFCMDSRIGQTLSKTEYEIIAVDDASTDESYSILEAYRDKYNEEYPGLIKVLSHDRNKKQGGARNTGLKNATGEFVGFVDSDDWASPDMYEKLIRRADETAADMVGCDYTLVTEHTFKEGNTVKNNTLEQTGLLDEDRHKLLFIRPGSMVIKIYRRFVIEENSLSFPEDMLYEDLSAGSIWSVFFRHFEKVEEPLYYYYQHEASTVHKVDEERFGYRKRAMEILCEECRSRGISDTYAKELEYRFTELYYINTLFSYMAESRHKKLNFIRELKRGVLERFPEFRTNKYYMEYTKPEEKSFIDIHLKSDIYFYVMYEIKHFIWNIRK